MTGNVLKESENERNKKIQKLKLLVLVHHAPHVSLAHVFFPPEIANVNIVSIRFPLFMLAMGICKSPKFYY